MVFLLHLRRLRLFLPRSPLVFTTLPVSLLTDGAIGPGSSVVALQYLPPYCAGLVDEAEEAGIVEQHAQVSGMTEIASNGSGALHLVASCAGGVTSFREATPVIHGRMVAHVWLSTVATLELLSPNAVASPGLQCAIAVGAHTPGVGSLEQSSAAVVPAAPVPDMTPKYSVPLSWRAA